MANTRTCSAVAAALFLDACAMFGAPGAAAPDRPGYTDAPTVLPAHAVQLEAGATSDRVRAVNGIPGTEYRSVGEVLLRYGVGARTELRFFGNSYATRITDGAPDVSGMEDAKIGVKVKLRSVPDSVHALLPSAALLVQTTVATGATGIGAGKAQPEAHLAVNWTTPSPFSVYANVGIGAIETGSGRATRAWTSVAGWLALNKRVSLFAEGLRVRPFSGGGIGTSGSDIDAGITFLVNDRLQLDLRAGHGVGTELSHEQFVGAGFAKRW